MSVLGYFYPRGDDLRMPKTEEGQPDELGIRYHGDVLTGKKGVREAIVLGDVSRGAAEAPGKGFLAETQSDRLKPIPPQESLEQRVLRRARVR